ncbi:MAG: DUF3039 domain-containing protein [Micromonosporaceae bacterium]|nr:DUF3039 domain-containing protein [Micromonosporaceae bacterium]
MTTPTTPTLPAETGSPVEERTDYRFDGGDHERFSHYVPREKLMHAMVEGTPVRALCGKLWVPSRDPQRFPVCPQCKEIHESLPDD